MAEIQFVKQYIYASRTAQVLLNTTDDTYSIYCFCCGEEIETPSFDTLEAADEWALAWVNHQSSLEQFDLAEIKDCVCS